MEASKITMGQDLELDFYLSIVKIESHEEIKVNRLKSSVKVRNGEENDQN